MNVFYVQRDLQEAVFQKSLLTFIGFQNSLNFLSFVRANFQDNLNLSISYCHIVLSIGTYFNFLSSSFSSLIMNDGKFSQKLVKIEFRFGTSSLDNYKKYQFIWDDKLVVEKLYPVDKTKMFLDSFFFGSVISTFSLVIVHNVCVRV